MTEAQVRHVVAAEGDLTSILNFVEVAEGDFFVIAAGTPHAIGAGLTLVEPQRILPGRRGLTYRYWDWNRRYDSNGNLDDHGQPRPLHFEDAVAVTRFDAVRGEPFVDQIRRRSGPANIEQTATFTALSGRDAPGALRFAPLSVGKIAGTGQLTLPSSSVLRAVTVVAGSLIVDDQMLNPGQSVVLAARGGDFDLQCARVHAVVAASHAA